jgi:hypothetical protein
MTNEIDSPDKIRFFIRKTTICLVYRHVSNINTCNKDITNVGVVLNFFEELSILVVKG